MVRVLVEVLVGGGLGSRILFLGRVYFCEVGIVLSCQGTKVCEVMGIHVVGYEAACEQSPEKRFMA